MYPATKSYGSEKHKDSGEGCGISGGGAEEERSYQRRDSQRGDGSDDDAEGSHAQGLSG